MRKETGFTVVEALVATSICLVVFLGIATAFTMTVKSALNNTARVQASFLEEEGEEVVRILRDNGWSANIASQTAGAPFYVAFDGSTWRATTTNAYVDSFFERAVMLDNVYRDSSKNIVVSGGTLDSNTKRVTVTVSWRQDSATTSRGLMTYLTNIFNN